uniref:Protein kinase-like domain, concanavalin A-like lectin/glucanase domain protein n=1 Tax=Tanacetum cinerariifolium TaxID=118510 RepID=A0A699HP71_TANCI|nr:protein kinase-like domain, concanavalin A-like lectin/glucanase domain protein [Tanacetum cinerariifolium]
MASQDARLSKFEADFKQKQSKMINKIDTVLKAITDRMAGALPQETFKNPKLNVNSTSLVLSARSYPTEDPQCSARIHSSINAITICHKRLSESQNDKPENEEQEEKNNPKKHQYQPFFTTRSIVLRKPFVEISNMTHDPPEGVVRFTNGTDEIAYKMSHKIEQYNLISDLERENTKSVNLRNEEDKIRGVEYVMSKILGFYKECLELGLEYLTGIADEGKVT